MTLEDFALQPYDLSQWRSKHEFVDEYDIIAPSVTILNVNGNLMYIGPKGCGKDHAAVQIALDEKAVMFKMQCFPNMSEMDLLGYVHVTDDNTILKKGIIPSACEFALQNQNKKVIVNLTEINLAGHGIINALNTFTDDSRCIYLPFSGETIKRPDNCKLVASMNPYEQSGYVGTQALNIAALDRFDVIYVDYLSIAEESKLLKIYNSSHNVVWKWANFAAKTREAYTGKTGQQNLTNVITTRNLIRYVQYMKQMDEQKVFMLARNPFIQAEWPILEKFWEASRE